MMKRLIVIAVGILVFSQGVAAEEDKMAEVKRMLSALVPGKTPDRIAPSPVPGIFEVVYGPQVFYMSKDGRFLIDGDIMDLKNGNNLTENRRAVGRKALIDSIAPETMISFAPEHVKHTVTVFTDVDCPYCRKMHQRMAEYNKEGIEIRYVAFPRTGADTPAYHKMVAVWCADDRRRAMSRAKNGQPVSMRQCDNPVDEHLSLANKIGISGTPTLVLEDGTMFPGYVSPKKLSLLLSGEAEMARQ